MQDRLLRLLEETAQRARAPEPVISYGAANNVGHIYFQDTDWSTVLDLSFDFQGQYATFGLRFRPSAAPRVEQERWRVTYNDGETIRKLMTKVRELLEARRPL